MTTDFQRVGGDPLGFIKSLARVLSVRQSNFDVSENESLELSFIRYCDGD